MLKQKVRVVLDTNVVVSALLFENSTPGRALQKALSHTSICVTNEVLEEYRRVLSRRKFAKYVDSGARLKFLSELNLVVDLVQAKAHDSSLPLRDSSDSIFIDAALGANADCLISGDEDLLVLKPYFAIPILTAAEFLDLEIK